VRPSYIWLKKREIFMPEQDDKKAGSSLALGVGVGVAIGAGLGAALHNMALGIALGIAIGAGIGTSWAAAEKKKKQDGGEG
jgi:hypothetical protein